MHESMGCHMSSENLLVVIVISQCVLVQAGQCNEHMISNKEEITLYIIHMLLYDYMSTVCPNVNLL